MKKGSKEYQEKWHEHLRKCYYPREKNIALFGFAPGNIGHAIHDHLDQSYMIQSFSESEFDVCNSEMDYSIHDTVIFNNGATHLDWIENQSDIDIDRVLDSVLRGNIKQTRDFVEQTLDSNYIKTIVYIGSMAHNNVLNGSAPYCAAKAGLQMFAKCMAYELAPKGYRVYCVNPSNVQGAPMSEETIQGLMRYKDLTRLEAEAYWASECPMGSFLHMAEIAEVVGFLLTDEARYLSGTAIDLPGGQR